MDNAVGRIAQEVKRGQDTGASLRIGVVVAVSDQGVQLDITGAAWCAIDRDVPEPGQGDRVYALQQGSVVLVVGRLTGTGGGMPPGAMTPYAGGTEPDGWLFCQGQTLDRASFPALFAAIGTQYGAPSATTFQLPNMGGRFPLGMSVPRVLGATGGLERVTLAEGEMPGHDHGSSGSHQHSGTGDHTHVASQGGGDASVVTGGTFGAAGWNDQTTGSSGWHQHGSAGAHTHGWRGSSQSHENMPPWMALHYIIRAV